MLLNLSPVYPGNPSTSLHLDSRSFLGRSLEDLTRILMPIIDDAVRRNIDKIANKISEKVNFKLSNSPLDKSFKDFNSNLVNVESKFSTDCEEHPDEGEECTLRSDYEKSKRLVVDPKAKRCKEGTDELKSVLSKTLQEWKIDTSDKSNFSFGLWHSGQCGTTLQDYNLGKFR